MTKEEQSTMNIMDVMRHLPHRYPFLLVDKVIDYQAGQYLKAVKNVSINEGYFQGHFPQRPVMPGVLIVEALAQASGILVFLTEGQVPDAGSLYYLASIDKARFKRVVEPGDALTLDVKLVKAKREVWKFETQALVDGQLACTVELTNVKRDT